MATEIRIPVKLDILQNSISDLQKVLNNLQPNTTGYKALEKIIQSMVQESQKLQAQLSRPFNNEGQFRATNKTIEKLEESAARISVVMDGLKFSDLKLTPEQQASFDKLNDEISTIRSNYQQLTNEVKQSVLNNSNNNTLITNLLGKNTLTADFADIRAKVNEHVSFIRDKRAELENDYNKLKSSAALAQQAKILTSKEGGITRQSIGESLFNKYLWQNGNETGFKVLPGQSKETFLREIEELFQLDQGTLQGLAEKTFTQINEAFQQMGQKGNLNPFQGLIAAFGSNKIQGQLVISKQTLDELDTELHQYIQLQNELNALQSQKIDPADTAAQARIASLTGEISKLEQQILSTATSSQGMKAPLTEIGRQADYLRTSLNQCNAQFLQMQRTAQSFNQMKMAIVNFMGFTQVLNLTKRAIKEAMNHIKELDSVMNKISIVTDMSTGDLWNQVDAYSKMAQTYGVSIKGAYEVSQIYYQQGLETADVMTLTNETLKLAKISGLDYATTTDYMTTALRGFKMEMSEASTVVDVYSNLAAHTAVSSEELAVAMSKTASSMESVGSTFEESSAMIATMVAVTRESATNIGSALKSIAARYGEMKKDPGALVDSEGETLAYNKVDAALQSVGITMKTADGQFREFTDVIVELSEKWNELDSVQQRYIATQFAGNRQQSRFLALVSNEDLLKSNLNYAENAEDTGTLQALKSLDSIESKTEQVRVAYQQFYTTIGAQDVWKGFLDGTKNVINTLNSLPKLFDKIPIGAIASISSIITLIKNIGIDAITNIATIFKSSFSEGMAAASGTAESGAHTLIGIFINALRGKSGEVTAAAKEVSLAATKGLEQETNKLSPQQQAQYNQNQIVLDSFNNAKKIFGSSNLGNEEYLILAQSMRALPVDVLERITQNEEQAKQILDDYINSVIRAQTEFNNLGNTADVTTTKFQSFLQTHKNLGQGLQSFGAALNMIAMTINTTAEGGKTLSGSLQLVAGAATIAGIAIKAIQASLEHTSFTIPWLAAVSGAMMLINGLSTLIVTEEERLEELSNKAEELSNKAKEEKANYRTLDNSLKKINELAEKRHESAEASEEYQTAVDDLAEKFPQLIAGFDEAGNIIINTTDAERVLTNAREKSAQATYKAAQAELDEINQKLKIKKQDAQKKVDENINDFKVESNRKEYLRKQIAENYLQGYQEEEREFHRNEANTFAYEQLNIYDSLDYDTFLQLADKFHVNVEEYLSSDGIEEKISTAIQELKQIDDITSEEGQKKYQEIQHLLSEAQDQDIDVSGWTETVGALGEIIDEYNELFGQQSGLQKGVISAWQRTSHNKEGKDWKYTQSDALTALVTNSVTNKLNTVTDENNNKLKATEENYKKLAQADQEALDRFYKFLNEDQLKQLEQMFSDTNNITYTDIEKVFGDTTGWSEDVKNLFYNYYLEGITSIQTRLKDNLKLKAGYNKDEKFENVESSLKTNTFYDALIEAIDRATTTTEESYLNNILTKYQSMADAGFTNYSQDYGAAALKTFTIISQLGGDLEKTIWNTINENGITTISGIESIIDSIKNTEDLDQQTKDNLIEYFTNMSSKLITNVNLEIQTATSNLLDTWEDTSKELSKVMSGGVTLKEADALIQKAKTLNLEQPITLDDFQLVGDKLVLTQKAFQNYYDGLIKSNSLAAGTIRGKIEAAEEINTDNMRIPGWSRQYKNKYEKYKIAAKEVGVDLEQYRSSDGSISVEGIQALEEAIAKSYEELGYYNKAAQIAADQLNNANDRKNGIYKIHAQDVKALNKSEIEAIISDKDLTLKGDDIAKRAIKDSVTSVYDTLISDVLSKGFGNININDYEGLIDGEVVNLSGKYEDFVKNYVNLTGKTIDEVNDLIIQARQKDRERTSEDLLKDLDFISESQFYATEDSLKDLANTFDKSFSELINSGAVIFNQATNEYLVNVEELAKQGINLNAVDNFKLMVQEAIDSLFKSITSDISSALSGKLDTKGVKNLTDNLSKIGINLDLQFIKTADGFKMAESSAISLYTELKKIDALQASLVFDELNKSLQENNEYYKTISSTMARIVELRQLKDTTDPTKKAQYEQELAVAEKIAAVRSATESDASFSFMSNNIPDAQNNPINYYENWATALQKYNEALKLTSTTIDSTGKKTKHKGLIDYQDWYNMVTEMNNIAALGGDIELGAYTLNGKAESAAKLIEASAAALTIDSNGKVKVALGDIADLGIDFSTGSQDMAKNVDEGIKAMAQSQVKMLDGMIQLLETIVAMESLGDIDSDNDNTIDLGEIFNVTYKEDGTTIKAIEGWNADFQKVAQDILNKASTDKELSAALDSVIVDGKSLAQMFKDAQTEWTGTDKEALAYQAVMNAFYQAAISGNYDPQNIVNSVKSVLAGTDYEGEITVGSLKLAFKYDTVFQVDEDGNIHIGKESFPYTDAGMQAALKYQKETELEALQGVTFTYDSKTGEVNFKNNIVTNVEYNMEDKQYTIKFSDGSSATASSREGANLAIATYAKMHNEELGGTREPTEAEPVSFVLHQEGKVDVEVTLKDGKIDTQVVEGSEGEAVDTSEISEQAQAIVDEQAEKAAQAAEGTTGEATIDGLKAVATGAVDVDISNAEVNIVGQPESLIISSLGAEVATLILTGNPITTNPNNIAPEDLKNQQINALLAILTLMGEPITTNPNNITPEDLKNQRINALLAILELAGSPLTINPNDITPDDLTNQIIKATLEILELSGDPITNNPENIKPDDLKEQQIKALLAILNLTGDPITENPENIKPDDLDPQTLKVLITELILNWLDPNSDHSPDLSALNIQTEVEAPDLVVTQKVIKKYEITDPGFTETPNTSAGLKKISGRADLTGQSEELGKALEKGWQGTEIEIGDQAQFDNTIANLQSLFNTLQANENTTLSPDLLNNLQTLKDSMADGILDPNALDSVKQLYSMLDEVINLSNANAENNQENTIEIPIQGDTTELDTALDSVDEVAETTVIKPIDADSSSAMTTIAAIDAAATSPQTKTIYVNEVPGQATKTKGNVALSKGMITGNALSSGNTTLMGELGPELVVSNGRYFIAGRDGAEMVNLADDAIVFNHIQTKSLLKNGHAGRGKAITNEQNAVAFAHGNINGGPAKASASAALAALKQLRAQWQALAGLSAKDLAGKAGGGGGGGGKNDAAFIKQLERWYNLLQQIATLEQKITYEETKRSKIQSSFIKSGKEYFKSQQDSLVYLQKEIKKHQQLADEQQAYFNKRQKQLNKQSAFSSLYTFDDNGQIQYKSGKFKQLSKRFGSDSKTGKPNYTVKQQYDWLIKQGYGYAMKYDESGNAIDTKDEAGMQKAIEAFWAKIEADKQEMQELHDSIDEHKKAVLEAQEQQNEILQEIEDNQINVENKVLKAIEDTAQREIDKLQDQKDAIEESNQALITGLQNALDKERQMYETSESESDLESKRRRLAILQRSGGSASEITSLQKDIDESSRDLYFNKQQEQIDVIQQASDNELEKLQQQIDIAQETLEYQKENGLLWQQVYDVMSRTPEEITSFIQEHDSEYWGKSPTELAQVLREDLFAADQWNAFAATGLSIEDYARQIAEKMLDESGTEGGSTTTTTTTGNGNSSDVNNGKKKADENTKWQVTYTNSNGKKVTRYFDTKKDAKAFASKHNVKPTKYTPPSDSTGNGGNTGGSSNGSKGNKNKSNTKWTASYEYDTPTQSGLIASASRSAQNEKDAKEAAALYAKKKVPSNYTRLDGPYYTKVYKTGGIADETGPAWLDGTKAKPEAVLNASQTQILRDQILSDKPDSLINLLSFFQDMMSNQQNMQSLHDSMNGSQGITIEHAEVNMKVDKMSDSYDAKKAAEDTMRELLNIARKTNVNNKIGR